jgi:hypothetical protein
VLKIYSLICRMVVSGSASKRRREYIHVGLAAASMPPTLSPALPDTTLKPSLSIGQTVT